jgi:hypothetical protein
MAKSDANFWSVSASGPYRVLAGCLGAFMAVGAILFLYVGLPADWRTLLWVPILLLNAGGLFGVARTGRWWGWRRRPGVNAAS